MQFAENVRKGPAEALMNACRRTESFGNAQSTVVKDFGAFQESIWYFCHPSSVAALLRRVDARTCAIFRARFPLPGDERTPFILPVRLYCVEGELIGEEELRCKYQNGHFEERVWECISFSTYERESIRFMLNRVTMKRYREVGTKRVVWLLHPYLTRIQQRFSLYLQRQGLPRISLEASGSED